jgi:molecular chaperone HscB
MLNPDFFALFGLSERFDVDLDALGKAYRAIQSSVHPDRFVRAMDADRRLAMQMSTHANEAFRTLSDPVQRALFLCSRHGVVVDTDRGAGLSLDFLEQQMQWREWLDEASGSRDRGQIDGLRQTLEQTRREAIDQLHERLDLQADYRGAAQLARQLMFIDKFEVSVAAADRALAAPAA